MNAVCPARLASICLLTALLGASARAADWSAQFADPPAAYGMGVHWWWFGPAVTRPEVERELNVMHRAGIANVLIYPVYPLSADDPARGIRNLRYLSPEFLDVLGHAIRYARSLGMTADMILGTGWPYGGPSVTPELAARKLLDVPTGMRVKRPSVGGEGLVLDHLNPVAVTRFLDDVGGKVLAAAGPAGLRAVHLDSLEVFGEEWTPDFPAAFAQRRGYELAPRLAALKPGSQDRLAPDVRFDFWRTLGQLAHERFIRPLHEWCRSHGVALQAESYGTPPVDMASYADVDDPAGESYDWKNFVASRWASSAAHQFGKRVTAAEAYTWLRYPRWVATLEDLKLASDLHFVSGINRIVAHGYNYSPPAAGVPGWAYYASVALNDNNTWWPYFPSLAAYVRRVSYALQLGKPRVDVALYLPEDDVMAGRPSGEGLNLYMETKWHLAGGKPQAEFGLPSALVNRTPVIETILAAGYTFDGFDHSLLAAGVKTDGGRLSVGDVAYRIAILPNLKGVSVLLLEILRDFCRAGGILIATRRLPDTAYGVMNREANTARVRAIVEELFGAGPEDRVRRNAFGRGLAVYVPDETRQLGEALASLGPEIDFGRPDADLAFAHRGEGRRQLYFVVNTSPRKKELSAVFRDGGGAPELWDPMTGERWAAPRFRQTGRGVEVPLSLEGYGSVLVVFADSHTAVVRRCPSEGEALPLASPWTLEIGGQTVKLDRLGSWTDLPAYRYFSGTAAYRTTFRVPAASGWRLELGEVHEIADVELNGKRAGVAWMRPYTLDVSRWIRPGENTIAIRVTNLLINRVLGQPDPDYSALEPLRFPLPEEKKRIAHPLPSGLPGPVRLVPRRGH
jgi:hypothetical protein